MIPEPMEFYLNILPWLVIFGLILDIYGAVTVLGPELEPIAKALTWRDHAKLRKLFERMEKGESVSIDDNGFQFLRITVGQSHTEGQSTKPAQVENEGPFELFWNFDEVDVKDSRLTFKEFGGTRQFHYNMDDLRDDVENFTATAKDHYYSGLFAFVSGFFLQAVGQLENINSSWSLFVFVIGGMVIIIIGYLIRDRYMPSYKRHIKSAS